MTKKKVNKYKYLSSIYRRVNEYIQDPDGSKEHFGDMVVLFCTALEKLMKMKLYKKNPFLIFQRSKVDDNEVAIIAMKKEEDIETANIRCVLTRYQIVFKGKFTADEVSAIQSIYKARNELVHGYKPDEDMGIDEEDILKKMGTVWEKLVKIADSQLGKIGAEVAKPKTKYTKQELEAALVEQVKRKITGGKYGGNTRVGYVSRGLCYGEVCPRCGAYSFSFEADDLMMPYMSGKMQSYITECLSLESGVRGLYKCGNCHLELTEKEYQIIKDASKSD